MLCLRVSVSGFVQSHMVWMDTAAALFWLVDKSDMRHRGARLLLALAAIHGSAGTPAARVVVETGGNINVRSGGVLTIGVVQSADTAIASPPGAPAPPSPEPTPPMPPTSPPPAKPTTVPSFSGREYQGAAITVDGKTWQQCGGVKASDAEFGHMITSFLSACNTGFSEIVFGCSGGSDVVADFVSPAFDITGADLLDTTCHHWGTGYSHPSVLEPGPGTNGGNEYGLLVVDQAALNCGDQNSAWPIYVSWGGQWGCNGDNTVGGSGYAGPGRLWAWVA